MKIKDNDHYGLYFGDPRYEKVWEQMKLLGIQDVTTMRQHKNGTIIWKLPIKNTWPQKGYKLYPKYIEVGSFASGMVRNNNSGYSNYQLNKCKADVRYYKDYKWNENFTKQTFTGKYNKYVGKQRILIPIEIDRLEYLIAYCLKNYYIKHANMVPNGNFVPKWKLENAQNGMVPKWKYDEAMDLGKTNAKAYKELEKACDKMEQRTDDFEKEIERITENNYMEPLQNLSVTVNGVNYEVI